MNLLEAVSKVDDLYHAAEKILDPENREYIEDLYHKMVGADTMCLNRQDQERIEMIYEDTFLK